MKSVRIVALIHTRKGLVFLNGFSYPSVDEQEVDSFSIESFVLKR